MQFPNFRLKYNFSNFKLGVIHLIVTSVTSTKEGKTCFVKKIYCCIRLCCGGVDTLSTQLKMYLSTFLLGIMKGMSAAITEFPKLDIFLFCTTCYIKFQPNMKYDTKTCKLKSGLQEDH